MNHITYIDFATIAHANYTKYHTFFAFRSCPTPIQKAVRALGSVPQHCRIELAEILEKSVRFFTCPL
jgi:hypothetical protein